MNKQSIIRLVIICLFVSIASAFAQDSSKAPIGFVKKVIRDVEDRQTSDEEWSESSPGTRIYSGHNIKTDIRSVAIVTFLDGSVLRVRQESEINIFGGKNEDKNSVKTNTDVVKGVVGFNVKKQNPDDEFTFTTPTGVASIRGTEGTIAVESDGQTLLLILEGLANLRANIGSEQNGDVGTGSIGTINSDGTVEVREASETEIGDANNAQNSQTKKYIIETSEGKFEIEILIDENSPFK